MKKGRIFLLLAGFFLATFSQQAHAASDDVWTMAQSDQYGRKAAGMIGRGLLNVATSFVDIIVHTVEGTQEGTPFVGTLTGLGSGLGCTALRLSSGALDVVTFWVPGFNGMPVGKSYSNCLEMEEENITEPPATSSQTYVAAPAPQEEQAPAPRKHHDPMDYVKK